MATLAIRFPAGRYHATPWGSHVNEGQIEWPPSPWRILRALLATGYEKLGWQRDRPPEEAAAMLATLAGVLPSYRLPSAGAAHSRHYMPMGRFKGDREETTLVIDTWARVEDEALLVRWPVTLDARQGEVLASLANALGYLGRAESWVEAALMPHDAPEEECQVTPSDGMSSHRPGWEQVPLLAAVSADDYGSWRAEAVASAIESSGPNSGRPSKQASGKRVQKIDQQYPADLVACLQVETSWLRALGWNQPPGSRRVLYWRPRSALDLVPPPRKTQRIAAPVECMLLSLTAGNLSQVLPHASRVLPQGELLHRALVSAAAKMGQHSVVLSGCDDSGRPLRLGHQHAHLLNLDLDADEHLDHVLVWAPMGLDAQAQAAVRATRHTFIKGGLAPLRLAIEAAGRLSDVMAIDSGWSERLQQLAPRGGAVVWRSITPFVPPRYLKNSGRNSLEGQVAAELRARGLPEPVRVSALKPSDDEAARRARHVIRRRAKGPQPPADLSVLLRLEFDRAVEGPIAIGYGSHLGLGLCAAVQQQA